MVVKKICMMGAFAVGKTSLVRRFVHSIFSETYQTTIGVMISKKQLSLDGQEFELIIWDLEGRDEFTEFRSSYLRGVSGVLFVVDVTRPQTLTVVRQLREELHDQLGNVPALILLNKSDLVDQWRIDTDTLEQLEQEGCTLLRTSAKTGANVEEGFQALLRSMTA
ncbi:MAG TPA: Rab family GTPase [Dongiaceae bacterium]|nr:Rab family GTPase [Dongiaceae bacterium]